MGRPLYERLSELIRNKGIQQKALAEAIGVSPSSLNGWLTKRRDPPVEYINAICVFLGMTPNELLEFDVSASGLDDDEKELLDLFRSLDRRGRRAILHEADVQMDRVRLEGDNHKAAQ